MVGQCHPFNPLTYFMTLKPFMRSGAVIYALVHVRGVCASKHLLMLSVCFAIPGSFISVKQSVASGQYVIKLYRRIYWQHVSILQATAGKRSRSLSDFWAARPSKPSGLSLWTTTRLSGRLFFFFLLLPLLSRTASHYFNAALSFWLTGLTDVCAHLP